jgi:NAD-dependent dihydropyrimidine dehydrogenase PreA subunit
LNKKINAMYFSGTGTTKKVVSAITRYISEKVDGGVTVNTVDFTLPGVRKSPESFTKEDLVIIGVPVIAGRVPNVLLKYLNTISGNGALAVPVVLYGNRNYDDALIELADILQTNGFKVIAGGAFIGEHSFSKILAQGRPDDKDMAIVSDFANKIYNKITAQDEIETAVIKGNRPYRSYYKPKDKYDNPVDIRKVKPKTNDNCIDCRICVDLCPMGSIDSQDVSKINGILFKFFRCKIY